MTEVTEHTAQHTQVQTLLAGFFGGAVMRYGDKQDGVHPSLVSVEWPGDGRLLCACAAWTGRYLQSSEPGTPRHLSLPLPSAFVPGPVKVLIHSVVSDSLRPQGL